MRSKTSFAPPGLALQALPTLEDVLAAKRRLLSGIEQDQRDQTDQAIRERCRTLYGFVEEAWPVLEPETPFIGGWAVRAICDHLEAVTAGRIRHLLINIPPGFAKSLIVSVFWPAWEWGPAAMPSTRILAASYEEGLAIRDNTRMRRLVSSEWYQGLWDVKFAKDQNAKTKFENTDTGGREARAFNSMTGGRGRRIIIDDPHSVKSGDMENQRVETVKTFTEAIPSRGDGDKAAWVIVMQRLHENDVSGAILSRGLPYVHLCLPMEFVPSKRCETMIGFRDPREYEGELLAPERVGRAEVEALKKALGPYAWAGQYQQDPTPRDGALFKVGMIEIVDALPATMVKRARAWDFGASVPKAGTDPDYTAGVRVERDTDGILYVSHVTRFRADGAVVKTTLKNTATQDGSGVRIRLPQDPGQAGKSQAQDFIRLLVGYTVTALPVTGDKVTRAEPAGAQVAAGNVKLLKGDWNEAFLAELASFPRGNHDDMVDAFADAVLEVSEIKSAEGLVEFFRQEAERLKLESEGVRVDAPKEGMVRLIPPSGISVAYGMTGEAYKIDGAGVITVHPDDAPAFERMNGWRRADAV